VANAILVWLAGITALYLAVLWRRYRTIRLAELPVVPWILLAGAGHRERLRTALDNRRPRSWEMLPGTGDDGLIVIMIGASSLYIIHAIEETEPQP
jgi:hypothetical protein